MTEERISRIERIMAVGTEARVDELTGVPFVREALPGIQKPGPLWDRAPASGAPDRARPARSRPGGSPGTDQ
ncbi:MAG: hypothetical protein M0Z49_09215 [Chloroflexi bacterium]|nr:hypothetical protein [Chloroflexota bacterium]